jgi:hypothetical protein
MHSAHDSLRKYRRDPLAHLSKADSEQVRRMRDRRNIEAHQLTRLEETEERVDAPVLLLRFTDGPQEGVVDACERYWALLKQPADGLK